MTVADPGLLQGLHVTRYAVGADFVAARSQVCPTCNAPAGAPCDTANTQRAMYIQCQADHGDGACPDPTCNWPGNDALAQLWVRHSRYRSILPGPRPGDAEKVWDYCNECHGAWPCSFALVAACLEAALNPA